MQSAFDANMVIADFVTFESDIKQLFLSTSDFVGGNVTDYTSYLAEEDPNAWSVSICSVDGQRLAFGARNHAFTLHSIIAPFLYALAIDTYGAEYVDAKVGHEIPPGGESNKISLDKETKPHNPMINTGAILMSTLYARDVSPPRRHKE